MPLVFVCSMLFSLSRNDSHVSNDRRDAHASRRRAPATLAGQETKGPTSRRHALAEQACPTRGATADPCVTVSHHTAGSRAAQAPARHRGPGPRESKPPPPRQAPAVTHVDGCLPKPEVRRTRPMPVFRIMAGLNWAPSWPRSPSTEAMGPPQSCSPPSRASWPYRTRPHLPRTQR